MQPFQDDENTPDFVPDSSAQQEVVLEAPPLDRFQGYQPNTDIFAINKQELSRRAGKGFVPLAPPTAQMLQNAADPRIGELIPQDHPEWQNLRSGNSSPHSPTIRPLCKVWSPSHNGANSLRAICTFVLHFHLYHRCAPLNCVNSIKSRIPRSISAVLCFKPGSYFSMSIHALCSRQMPHTHDMIFTSSTV